MAFLDGNQPERLCAPMVDHIKARHNPNPHPNPTLTLTQTW